MKRTLFSVLCIATLATMTSCDTCRVDPLFYLDSPGRTNTAIVFDRDCGPAGHSTHLSVVSPSTRLGRSGNIAVFDGVTSVDLDWKDDKNLIVTHDATAKVFLFEKEFSGIRIHEIMR